MEQKGTVSGNARISEASQRTNHVVSTTVSGGYKPANQPGRLARIGFVLSDETRELHLRLRLVNTVLVFCPQLCFSRLRTSLYRFCGIRIGFGTLFIGNATLSGGGPIHKRLQVGRDCVINAPMYFDLNAEITIGNEVFVGHHVVFITTEHELGPSHHRAGHILTKPITVGNGCWIGACATIMPGVTIGDGSIISAGSVVASDVPPNKVFAGNPARPIKALD